MEGPMKPVTIEQANQIGMLQTLGIRLTDVGDDYAVMEVIVDERHSNYFGGVHGGLLATLVDTVAFFPKPLLPSGRMVTTANLTANYLKGPQLGDRLIARSQIEHLGRRTVSLTVRVTGSGDKLLVHGSVTLIVLKPPDETTP